MKFLSVTIQIKATEQYFRVALFSTLEKLVLTSNSKFVDEIIMSDKTYFSVVLFITF